MPLCGAGASTAMNSMSRPSAERSTNRADVPMPGTARAESLFPDAPLADDAGILVSEAAALSAFTRLKNDDGFVWDYIDDCCLARAHKMCRALSAMGVRSEKIRVDNADGTWIGSFGLAYPKKNAHGDYIYMSFHIAPVVKVRTDSGVEERIIDPALCDAPVARDVWASKLINRHSIRPDGGIDRNLQEKVYTRLACDVFETVLFWEHKDDDMKITNELLARHRREHEMRTGKREPLPFPENA